MKIVITAGGTSERIDNVRKITNSSSGKLGMTIANAILDKHRKELDTLYYICAKDSLRPKNEKVKIVEITGTLDLEREVKKLLTSETIDYFIHSMAVSDYMVSYVSTASLLAETIQTSDNPNLAEVIKNNKNVVGGTKISSYEDNLLIMLKPTPKIIALVKDLSPQTFLVGFKLLDGTTDNELIEVATKLLQKNRCNLVVANDLANIRSGNHKAFIIDGHGDKVIANGKEDIAEKLAERLFEND
ncbi:MAG: hypothetical protein LBK50_03255 [Candidatus Nomurabacteria bacterium]|jgi:phosphopantothenate-cysteine ligase|nr:hypothetical protein [Candidatus Nomurabacteria bacterium]